MMTEAVVEERGGRETSLRPTPNAPPSDTPTEDRQQTQRLPEEQKGQEGGMLRRDVKEEC